ncbi:DUF6933 domain-containing protein [Arenimonas daejeonensis]|uniref:DUF6933 domain-containing protein n=1 Tax=Arenimonas daejeonensis TaxID=370777 RepID=UPI0011BED556|nr:hypothetical protein [Arenimonas daejeonensis]
MVILRCTARLLKRLRQPAKPPEPPPADNPLGEWYADIDFLDREPFVVMLNAATGAALVVPGRAADLRDLHIHAGQQMFKVLVHYGFDLDQPRVAAELSAWNDPPAFAATRDRSVLGSLRRVKDDAWHHFAYYNRSLPEAALQQWDGFYSHPSLPKRPVFGRSWRPLELVASRLMPGASAHPMQ